MTALVVDSAEALDRMPEATTRARLALVASRLAAVVGTASWFVGVAHEGRLYDVSCGGGSGADDATADGAGTGRFGAALRLPGAPPGG